MLDSPSPPKNREAKRLSFAEGRYVVRGEPKSGGWASVYCATDTDTGETVAIKVFRTGEGSDEIVKESFRREVQALSDLRHPNIVRILDSGIDSEKSVHFLVMEWIDQDLKSHCENRQYHSWAEYFNAIGKPILEALSFAHSHSVAHRDIKPTNVLITSDGQVKLCDFGISKIRSFLTPGVTLAQFASVPFAPPEQDDGSYSYSRDVFGFSTLSAAILTGQPVKTYDDVINALEKSPIEESTKKILRSCLLQTAPEERPQNAAMLQLLLERSVPTTQAAPSAIALLILTNKVRDIIEADIGIRNTAAERFLEKDLTDACGENAQTLADRPEWRIRVHGAKYSYTLILDDSGKKLKIIHALEYSPSELETKRSRACRLPARLSLTGCNEDASREAIDTIRDRLLEFDGDQKARRVEEREQFLFKTWLALLSAQTELEKSKKIKIPYGKVSISGDLLKIAPKIRFVANKLIGQDVIINTAQMGHFSGIVITASEHEIILRPSETNRVDAENVPPHGQIETDTTKADRALDKQKAAIEAVRYGRSTNPELGKLIANPESVKVPVSIDVNFIQKEIDEDKKDAVRTALSGPDLMIVEGPPGTGKTTFITELVLQVFRTNPHARILLTSQTHVALDNSLERIVKTSQGGISAVRIGHETDERIAESTKKFLLDAKLPEIRKTAIASGKAFIEKWAESNNISVRETRRAMALERHAGLKERQLEVENELINLAPKVSDDFRKTLDIEIREELDELYQGLSKERSELNNALKESLIDLRNHVETEDEFREFSECTASDLRGWAEAFAVDSPAGKQLKELLLAHADWEARFGRSRQFRAAVIASSQIVAGTCLGVGSAPGRNELIYDLCIVDEASIATPTQVLVPMSKARRTVLVGDNKQLSPFQDPELRSSGLLERYNLSTDAQSATLFSHLSDTLPFELRKKLTTQHRMLPAIGNLVSECFYGEGLYSVDRDPAAHLKNTLPSAVTWFSTSNLPNHSSKSVGTTYYNDLEIEHIINLLNRVDFYVQSGRHKSRQSSVAILTGYGEQRERLNTAIETKRHNWKSFSEIFVNVVDAFQGREADIVIFSITRSEEKSLGFLREMERINVALSRGKELLAIVGDHVYCQTVKGSINPLKDVLDYIRRNSATCTLEVLKK